MPVLSGNISLNSAFHKRLSRLREGCTNLTTKNRTVQEALQRYERNKKRRARSESKSEVVKEEDIDTKKEEPTVEVNKTTSEADNDVDKEEKKGNEIKLDLDSLIRTLPSQYRPIDFLAEQINLKSDNKTKHRPFSAGFAKAVENLAKESLLDLYSEEEEMPIVKERRIDFNKVFGIDTEDKKIILPSNDLKGRCVDLMSLNNVPLESENKYINAFDITPSEIQSTIETVPLYSVSREEDVSEELLINVVENLKNLDLISLQEQSEVNWNDSVDLSSIYIPQN